MQKERIIKNLKDTKRRVDITRGCRIEANKRLKRTNDFVNVSMFIHTFIIVILTLGSINNISKELSHFVLIYSIATTVISLYINSRNYNERALRFEHNYRGLERLSNKILMEIDSKLPRKEKLREYVIEYESLIDDKENHENVDYTRFIHFEKERNDEKKDNCSTFKEDGCAAFKKYCNKEICFYCSIITVKGMLLLTYPIIIFFFLKRMY